MALSILFLACALPVLSNPLVERAITTQITFQGNYTNAYTPDTYRDLGFVGKIGSAVVNSFGDTAHCAAGQYPCYNSWANSAGLGLSATKFKDTPDTSTPNQFCKYFSDEDASTYGMGITNVVPTSSSAGILYTLPARRNLDGAAARGFIIGAGLAVVTIDSNSGAPVCWRESHHDWDGFTEPWYGDHSAFLDASGAYVYALGGANVTNAGGSYIFISRVPVGQASNVSAHQYWNGIVYADARITAKKQYAVTDTSSNPLLDVGQGQVKYNHYLGKFVMLYAPNSGFATEIRMRTSNAPQGPYSDYVKIYDTSSKCSSTIYGIVYDDAWYTNDQTITVRYTCHASWQQVLKVVFSQ